eukprot:12536093-Alexandrium_andersonii.AAC.1
MAPSPAVPSFGLAGALGARSREYSGLRVCGSQEEGAGTGAGDTHAGWTALRPASVITRPTSRHTPVAHNQGGCSCGGAGERGLLSARAWALALTAPVLLAPSKKASPEGRAQ